MRERREKKVTIRRRGSNLEFQLESSVSSVARRVSLDVRLGAGPGVGRGINHGVESAGLSHNSKTSGDSH